MTIDDDAQLSEVRIPVPADHSQAWVQNTYAIRACELVLSRTVDPQPGSPLDRVDAIYHWEKISVWARSYLLAAAENLGMWADLVAPYDFAPDATNKVRLRPYLLLARSGLEAASHAIWLLDVPTKKFEETVQRHVRLMHRDFSLHKKALDSRGSDASRIAARITTLEERAAELPFANNPKTRPPGYGDLVRNAATVLGKDADEWVYLWNAASGAGHGQNWFGIEGFDLFPTEEYQPGHFRTVSIPDPIFITDTIEAAAFALQWGMLRWLEISGHDPNLLRVAVAEIHAKMPKKDDSTS